MYKVNDVAKFILESDYLLPNETIEQMFRRTCEKISSVEKTHELQNFWFNKFYNSISNGLWIPATPFLMNSGVNNMFSSCFVVGGLNDDLDSIFETNKRSANVTKMGGGIGLNISKLREKGAKISTTKGESTGAISFMKVFNTTLDVVMQARRRGAGIIVMDVYHPDIESFITVKSDHNEINNFNISVLVDDNFMKSVKENLDIELKSPLGYVVKKIGARYLFNKITTNARYHAEPGIIFKSTINKDNPCLHNLGEIDSVNACAEIPLYPDEACNLSAMNLQMFIDNKGVLNKELLKETTEIITRFLDNSIDLNQFPDNTIKKAVLKTRKIGIGVMGMNGLLVKRGLKYDSEEGRKFAKSVLKIINDLAHNYSCQLIEEGRELPEAWYGSTFEQKNIKIRNLSVTSGQPTGATQILMSEICASSGIEPFIAIVYKRKVRDNEYILTNSLFEEIGTSEGWYNDNVKMKILHNNGSCQDVREVPKKWQELFKTTAEIPWEDHVKMQSELQKVTTNAISKTINMSQNSTVEDVYNAYMLAHDLGCKGVTVYVQNSRDGQVLTFETKKEEKSYVSINPVQEIADAKRLKIKTGCGSMWLIITYDDSGNICETFAESGGKGGCSGMTKALSRIISLCLRANIDPRQVIEQLQSVTCDVSKEARRKNKDIGLSCGDGIARQMLRFINGELKINTKVLSLNENKTHEEHNDENLKCDECKQYTLTKYDGCVECVNCGWKKCR